MENENSYDDLLGELKEHYSQNKTKIFIPTTNNYADFTPISVKQHKDILKTNERSYIIFEMTPGFFSANIENKEFQESLFGSLTMNNNNDAYNKLKESLENIREKVKNGDIGIDFVVSETKKSNDELLEEALENEDYEEAAKIRDKIKNKK